MQNITFGYYLLNGIWFCAFSNNENWKSIFSISVLLVELEDQIMPILVTMEKGNNSSNEPVKKHYTRFLQNSEIIRKWCWDGEQVPNINPCVWSKGDDVSSFIGIYMKRKQQIAKKKKERKKWKTTFPSSVRYAAVIVAKQ